MKRNVSVYTNIPTPYQADFFDALSAYVNLTVIYYAHSERGRHWAVDDRRKAYRVVYLQDSSFARLIQRWVRDYHFSWSIVNTVFRDPSDYVLVSGAYWTPNAVFAMLLARCRHKTVAFFGERLAGSPTTGWKAGLKRAFLWPMRSTCSRVFAIGQEAARTYADWGINASKTVMPYTVDTSRFANNRTPSSSPQPLFVFLSVGSLTHRKGMDILIRAMRALDQQTYGHVRLRIVGDGIERAALEQLAGTDPRIEWAGFVGTDALPDYFMAADAFVLASRYDGWGVVINEAIAAGLPVISSNTVGAARAWIEDGVNGFLCPPNDVDAFAKAMRRLVDEPVMRECLADVNRDLRAQTSSAHYASVFYQTLLNDLDK